MRKPHSAQMEENVSNVILINKLTVKPEDVDQLLRAWTADAAYFKQQPGFISTQLHRGIGGSCVFINYAVWESTELYKRAFKNPEFQPHQYLLSSVASPHLFKKVAVPGICVDWSTACSSNADLIDEDGKLINDINLAAGLTTYRSGTITDGVSKLILVVDSNKELQFSINGTKPDNLTNGALSSLNQSDVINNLSSSAIVSPQNISNGKSVVVTMFYNSKLNLSPYV
jgi:heme-degrading monooxygenase HmoA